MFFIIPASALVICTPGRERRRRLARVTARLIFRLMGVSLTVDGLERLPQAPCIVVANHASYLDGPLLTAILPPRFGFVIKREITRAPLVGRLLARLGSEFVDRFDKRAGHNDAHRLIQLARSGASLGVFPEGTFTADSGLRHFHLGAFMAAVRAGVPIVPVVIRGTRQILPANTWRPRAGNIIVEVLDPLYPLGDRRSSVRTLCDTARSHILARCGEPDCLHHGPLQAPRKADMEMKVD